MLPDGAPEVKSPPEAGTTPDTRAWVLEWYRRDSERSIVPPVIGAALLTLVGCLFVAASVGIHRFGDWFTRSAATLGVALTACGPLLAIFALRRGLQEEAYLALRNDGLVVHEAAKEHFVSWDELVNAEHDVARDIIVLERRSADALLVERRYGGLTRPALVKRINDVRRKALWNQLR